MIRSRVYIGALLLFFLLLAGGNGVFALDPETAYQRAKQSYIKLQQSSKDQLYRDNWMRVIDDFVGVAQAWPDHRRAPDAFYMAGKASKGLYQVSLVDADARQAVRFFDRLADSYDNNSLADDSLLLAGELLEDPLQDYSGAYQRYARIVRDYPRSDMFTTARPRAKRLARFATDPVRPTATRTPASGYRQLVDVRSWSGEGKTRIVLDFNGNVEYRVNYLSATGDDEPAKVYLDLQGAGEKPGLPDELNFKDGLVSQVRTGHPQTSVLRVVLDLTAEADYRVFTLNDPARIVIDLSPGGGVSSGTTASSGVVASMPVNTPEFRAPPAGDDITRILEQTPAEQALKVQIPNHQNGAGLRRIVVDAGHGGKDPGAIGKGGTMEKDVALALALELASQLRKALKCEVLLTRDRDVYLPLDKRTSIANQVNADLFISIHANASKNRNAYGIETYYLNFSKNDDAVKVAARENNTSLKEVGDLELILFDLMANSKINESSRLATEVQKALVQDLRKKYSRIKDLGVRQGPFYVLLGATMPSVLVETAFLSNKVEEQRLKDSRYHQRTAAAIVNGVRRYAQAFKLIASK